MSKDNNKRTSAYKDISTLFCPTCRKPRKEGLEAIEDGFAVLRCLNCDTAWSAEIKSPFGGLHVVSGSYVLIIKINSGKEKNNLKQAKKLALIALEKL